ncbi:hypothetical protein OXYTRIMIC_751 [Oxytricha trifallax]|uniref:Uncharacterized protein n=1 Tax=Oxytricha trifallax TaxID=1172189 RepID=A0A073IC28_9SPIT|nr:hypothetical protein OXYTRIMIC_751 [Oxytricha trifallax]
MNKSLIKTGKIEKFLDFTNSLKNVRNLTSVIKRKYLDYQKIVSFYKDHLKHTDYYLMEKIQIKAEQLPKRLSNLDQELHFVEYYQYDDNLTLFKKSYLSKEQIMKYQKKYFIEKLEKRLEKKYWRQIEKIKQFQDLFLRKIEILPCK